MFRARASASALVCIAVVMLAVAGCKIDPPAAAGADPASTDPASADSAGPAAGQEPGPGATRVGALIIEPGAGFSPVYALIKDARHSIDMTMYEFADSTAEHDLAAAAKRGVKVQVILDKREKSLNSNTSSYLNSHRVKVVWSSSRFTYTHQKTLVIDGSKAVIMTANLTSKYYATSRDFLVVDTGRADVAAITTVFDADFAHRAVIPGDGADLIWSPTDSQSQLLALINGATSSLRIYSEEMGDTTVENALVKAAKRGVDVQVCGENEDGEYDRAYTKLARAGVHISYYSSSSGFYIHGKVVEADYGTGHARMFVGSENFSRTSLDDNRELGLIIFDPAVLSAMARTFAADFRNGHRWP
jgi:phosphatidylserine/phosphatidylglycerophosphate/cardiolipin synthase-like enzyme